MSEQREEEHPALRLLEPDERIEVQARANDAHVLVTDRRVAIADNGRLALVIPYEGLRRIQFDIERQRPATMVIVPESPEHEPQVLAVPPEEFPAIATALAVIGQRLASLG